MAKGLPNKSYANIQGDRIDRDTPSPKVKRGKDLRAGK